MNCHAELDPLDASSLLTDAERALRDEAARAVDEKLLPIAADAFEKGEMPEAAVRALAAMGAFGASMYGAGPMGYGLMMQEIERPDSGFRSSPPVPRPLQLVPTKNFGSPHHKQK